MTYTLMHKKTPVAEIDIDDDHDISNIVKVFNHNHLPVGLKTINGEPDAHSLDTWWTERGIPSSRPGINEAMEIMNIHNENELLTKGLGLSLSDQYWVCPIGENFDWDDINLFKNDFSKDVGNVLFGDTVNKEEINFRSPDSSSNGWLKKRWIISDTKRLLIKGGSSPFYQEPFNEVIASEIMERLNIPHIPYSLTFIDGKPYSVCENFITQDTELINAWYIARTNKKTDSMSEYQHFVKCCDDLGIDTIKSYLNKMITLDYLIGNTDRHYNNFGIIRNAETLEWLEPAPVFDSGTSLWHDKNIHEITDQKDIASKPFRNRHSDQIKLVTDFKWMNIDSLKDIHEKYKELLDKNHEIDNTRKDKLRLALKNRIESFRVFIQT